MLILSMNISYLMDHANQIKNENLKQGSLKHQSPMKNISQRLGLRYKSNEGWKGVFQSKSILYSKYK